MDCIELKRLPYILNFFFENHRSFLGRSNRSLVICTDDCKAAESIFIVQNRAFFIKYYTP